MSSTSDPLASPIRLGVAGLGRAFVLMLPAFRADKRVKLVAAASLGREGCVAFEQEFGGRSYQQVEDLCADPEVEAIYVATPHQLHAAHVLAAAAAGKHVLVEKPLAVSLAEAEQMVEACREAGVHLITGPSHSFDAPVAQARDLLDRGDIGRVRMIQAFNYTDFLYRPRRPEELRTEDGGGVVFSQGAHQIDIVRLLAGAKATEVVARAGIFDPARTSESAYSALVSFDSGSFATLTYSGFAHFDSDEWMDWVDELGNRKSPDAYGAARRALRGVAGADDEVALKNQRVYGAASGALKTATHHEHFGPIVITCDKGDLRLTPGGLHVYGDSAREFRPAPPLVHPRQEVIEALAGALRHGRHPVQSGAWGLASLEICHAILNSAKTGQPVRLQHQISLEEARQ